MTEDVRPDSDQLETKRDESSRPELEGPAADALAAEEASKAAASDTFDQAIDGLLEPGISKHHEEDDQPAAAEPAPRLERLQKILAQAGVASRRHAEELITAGRVQVNGKVVTELGTKADATRDHIRVDGKLLQGSERLRYFMLNKPKGYVTTVSDPEGRPTIMEFFKKMRERLYPVGRLDYLSEGLLVVTNDGELANKLTRAAAGVEKTYLVKVSGQPSEEDIDRLREGVGIERGRPGSGRVQTAPAEIRKMRSGDNPWYEVVLIEGRNRELRKMFEEIGHHVEKIRRVGYGPLELDLEPGKVRELEPEEVENLRKAAEGKYRKPRVREGRKRNARPESPRSDSKPGWKPRSGEPREERRQYRRPERAGGGRAVRPERGDYRRPERTGSGESRRPERAEFRDRARGVPGRQQRPERGDFRGRPRDDFRAKPRFEETRPQRPPRREPSDQPGARPERSQRDEGRASGGFRSGARQESRPKRFGGGQQRPQRSGSSPRFNSKQRPRFDVNSEQGPARGPRSEREREQTPQRGPRFDRDRDRDREQKPRFDRRGAGGPERQPMGQKDRSERPATPPRPGRFNRPGPGARGKGFGPKSGSVRSGGGRHTGSRPGGKPGKNQGGKRRG